MANTTHIGDATMAEKPYFALDLDNRCIKDEMGNVYTVGQFKNAVAHCAEQEIFMDLTLMTQRFVRMGYDFDALEAHYAAA